MSSLSKSEKETISRVSEDPLEPATLYTHSKTQALSLIKRGAKVRFTNETDKRVIAWCLELPREWFRYPKPPRRVSPETAKRLSENLHKARSTKKSLSATRKS